MLTDNTVDESEARRASELSYRRGYVHGYSHAIDDAAAGKSRDEMNDHVDKKLSPWRETGGDQRLVPPAM